MFFRAAKPRREFSPTCLLLRYYPCVAFDIGISAVLAVVVLAIAIWGGVIAARNRTDRTLFWSLGAVAGVLSITQVVRQAQSQDAVLKTISGGDSFSFARVEVGDGVAYFLVLNSGPYPLYDLSMRVWRPDEWKELLASPTKHLDLVWSKAETENTVLGSLPNDDYRRATKSLLPSTGTEYEIEFSARNGSWDQLLWVRPSLHGWRTASIVRHTKKVGGAEAQKPGPVICYYIDQDFPFGPDDDRTWARDAPRCAAGSAAQ